jgi:hypothetical protein
MVEPSSQQAEAKHLLSNFCSLFCAIIFVEELGAATVQVDILLMHTCTNTFQRLGGQVSEDIQVCYIVHAFLSRDEVLTHKLMQIND